MNLNYEQATSNKHQCRIFAAENKRTMIDEKAKVNLREIANKKLAESGWKQTELAQMLGLTKQGMNNYLKGRANLTYEQVERLLQVFDLIKNE